MSDPSTAGQIVSPLLDPASLRIPTGARHTEQRKRHTSDLTITKPKADQWVLVHPDEAFRWEGFWTYEKDKSFYLLSPTVYDQLEDSVQRVFAECDFYLAAVLNADPIVWMIKHSDTDYFRTMRVAIEAAMTDWVQMQSNQRLKQYDHKHPQTTYANPDWSEYSTQVDAQKVFTALFANRVITESDHDILERIRGRK
jgi:hypothetical protein